MAVLNTADDLLMGAEPVLTVLRRGTAVWTRPSAPVNSSPPVVSGAVNTGDTAVATPGTWSGTPTSYAYQWQVLDGTWDDIPGATSSSYEVPAAGEYRVAVVASNAAGASDPAYSTSFVVVDAPTGVPITWGDGSSSANITDSGRRLANVASSGVANARAIAPIPEGSKIYQEARCTYGNSNGGSAFGLIGSGNVPTSNSDYIGRIWEEPNVHCSLQDEWSMGVQGNYGLPGDVSDSGAWLLDGGALPQFEDIGIAVDATDLDEVKVWVRVIGKLTDDGDEWYGGGDPATGTTPSITLLNCPSLYFGGTSDHPASDIYLRDASEFTGTVPTGFVAGQVYTP